MAQRNSIRPSTVRWHLFFLEHELPSHRGCGVTLPAQASLGENSCPRRNFRPAKHLQNGRHSQEKATAVLFRRIRRHTNAAGKDPRLLASVAQEVDPPVLLIDVLDLPDDPGAMSYLILQLCSLLVIDIEVIPAVAL